MRGWLKALTNLHIASSEGDIFIFAAARSGSTLLHDLILTQPGFKPCTSPFDLRNEAIARHLARFGITSWADLYSDQATEAIAAYIHGISKGHIRISEPIFFRNHFRFVTRRIAFKILDGCEDLIPSFSVMFGGRIVYLLRHPIPVALSRRQTPRLEVFVTSNFNRHFTRPQLEFARRIIVSGTMMERAVLDWCLQSVVPLRQLSKDWAVVSYEQLVLDPGPVVDALSARLSLPRPDRMLKLRNRPSYSTVSSDDKTKQMLKRREQETDAGKTRSLDTWLVEKWRERIDEEEERRLMEILDVFEIEAYRRGSTLPADQFWIRSREATG